MIILGCSPMITSLLCRCVPVCLSVSTWRVLHWSVNVDNGYFLVVVSQVELDRFQDTLFLLQDYYTGMEG